MKRCSKWSQAELQLLQKLIDNQADRGRKDWQQVSKQIPGKTPRQCYDAFHLQLAKEGNQQQALRHVWSQDEVQILLTFKSEKTTWQRFQEKHFPNLSVCQIKNKHRQLLMKPQKQEQSIKPQLFTNHDQGITLCRTPIASGLINNWDVDYSEDINDEIGIFINANFDDSSFQ